MASPEVVIRRWWAVWDWIVFCLVVTAGSLGLVAVYELALMVLEHDSSLIVVLLAVLPATAAMVVGTTIHVFAPSHQERDM